MEFQTEFSLFLLLLFFFPEWTAASDAVPKLVTDQIDWLLENDGIFNSKLEIRRSVPGDPNSHFGMFAKENIPEKEVLLLIPRKVLLTDKEFTGDPDDYEDGQIWCPTAFNLIDQMRLGKKSFYAPYVLYLLSQEQGQLPTHWSDAGKAFLLEVLNHDNNADSKNRLRPFHVVDLLEGIWHENCDGSHDVFEENAALLLAQRGWDDMLIPVYDMMSHVNGPKLNTDNDSVHDYDIPIRVWASRDIVAGEEIYTSYTDCRDCGNRIRQGYGTAEVFRDYGFVENYPQRWFFGKRASFELDEQLQVSWIKELQPKFESWFRQQLDRLRNIKVDERRSKEIPRRELDMIVQYQQAVIVAIEQMLKAAGATAMNDDSTGDVVDESVSGPHDEF